MSDFQSSRFDQGIEPPLNFPCLKLPTRRSTLHSPLVGKVHDVVPFDYRRYEEYLDEVIEVRLQCASKKFPVDFMKRHYPKNWGVYPLPEFAWPEFLREAGIHWRDVDSCIEAVRMDTPLDLGLFILRWLRDKGSLKIKANYNYTPFLETFPNALVEMAGYISKALHKCFEVKYFYGVARPEQMYEEIRGGKREDLVAYPAPIHPSYGAGHSAAAAATADFFIDNFVLSKEDEASIKLGAYYFGQFRTMAGVHYAVDNLAGLQIGGLDVGYKKL
jgi:hypothetical protein